MKSIGKNKLAFFLLLHLGILFTSVGIYFFKATNNFVTGGVSGLSVLLARLVPVLSQATYMLIINFALILIGLIFLGKQCSILTVYASSLLSLLTLAFERFVPLDNPLTDLPFLELVWAVLLTGIGAALLFRCNASTGGTDIVALVLKKYTSLNVSQALLLTDFIISVSAFMVYGVQTGLLSLLGLFAKAFVIDDVLESINMCKAFTVITTESKAINEYITKNLGHSATSYDALGAYTGENRTVILTVCHRAEAAQLRRRIKEIDSHAFIIITNTSEIMGKGFGDK